MTCLVAKRDVPLANRIEEAIKKNESLESLSVDSVRRDIARTRITQQQGSNIKAVRTSTFKNSSRTASAKSAGGPGKSSGRTTSTKSAGLPGKSSGRVTLTKSAGVPGRSSGRAASAKPAGVPGKGVAAQASARKSSGGKFGNAINQSKGKPEKVASQFKPAKKAVKVSQLTSSSTSTRSAKISVVGFRGRSSSPVTKN